MSIGGSPLLIGRRAKDLAPELAFALAQLAKARGYAQEFQCESWEFAVEIDRLLALGVTTSDLRWLIKKGYIEHAREITQFGDTVRRFQPARSLAFSRKTCFFLAEAGVALLKANAGLNGYSAPLAAGVPGPKEPPAPRWDHDNRILYVDVRIVKEFRVRSPNQESVLSVFEEEGWPRFIDDPLSPSDQHPKHRLRDTIKGLNANQKNRLIRFRGDGTGERVRWDFVGAAVPESSPCESSDQSSSESSFSESNRP
ncbi:MAG: hypothetical protein ABR915_05350 [Thermoguttaceae bacterium]|jgi:hypothetical protein